MFSNQFMMTLLLVKEKKKAKDWIAGIRENAFSFTGYPRGVLSYLGMQLGQ